ncbi:hypothetical protein [Micromonospora costi]|uniref:Uncharacterized protein n=1 Tax=Micromonospora costi TaxID=1530042 RepID=A0A3B0ACL7_9ACTN|nr:hypothetical protein [Micromonospora costi]RKN58163.1 hypothetical protein D7193_06125 [Micromonospora costi]
MRLARPAGLLLAAVGAVLWAVNMTVLQPLTEPLGPWSERFPGNNAYWARDLRFATIVAVVLGLLLAGRGDRWWSRTAVLLGGAWVAADLAVDRADPTGAGATVLLAAAGCAVVAAVATPLVRREMRAPAPGPDRPVLTGAACVAGVLTLVAATIESPTDREPELNPAAFTTGALLVVVAVAAALAAAPAATRARCWLAVGLGAAAVLGVGLLRTTAPGTRMLPQLALSAVLLTGVTLLAWDWPGGRPDWGRQGLAALAALVGPTAMMVVAALLTMTLRIGAPFTALAGNSPINSADSDILYSLVGVLAGLGMALLLANRLAFADAPVAGRPARPQP